MTATAFEFRNRSLIITAIFVLGFSLYAFGDRNLLEALLRWLGRWPGIPQETVARVALWLGALLALSCAIIRTWAAAYLDTQVVHDRKLHSARLVADGPYRRVRNPLYLGTVLLSLGFVPLTSRFGAPVLVVGILTFVDRLIRREEAELLRTQGDAFRAYSDAVPRLLPSLVPRVPCSGDKPLWLRALLGEAMMWGFFAALAGFAWTLSARVYGFAMAFALVSSAAVKAAVWRKPRVDAAGAEP